MILAFGHQSRVGKNLAAEVAVRVLKENGIQATVLPIARVLKDYTEALFGHLGVLSADYYERVPAARDLILPDLNKTVVDLWIEVGQAMRNVHEDIWIEQALIQVRDLLAHKIVPVISDLRFDNEGRLLREAGAWIYRIDRPGQKVRGSDTQLDADFPWTGVISNDGSKQAFEMKVEIEVLKFAKEVRRARGS